LKTNRPAPGRELFQLKLSRPMLRYRFYIIVIDKQRHDRPISGPKVNLLVPDSDQENLLIVRRALLAAEMVNAIRPTNVVPKQGFNKIRKTS
jgi:hypothetical protein